MAKTAFERVRGAGKRGDIISINSFFFLLSLALFPLDPARRESIKRALRGKEALSTVGILHAPGSFESGDLLGPSHADGVGFLDASLGGKSFDRNGGDSKERKNRVICFFFGKVKRFLRFFFHSPFLSIERRFFLLRATMASLSSRRVLRLAGADLIHFLQVRDSRALHSKWNRAKTRHRRWRKRSISLIAAAH